MKEADKKAKELMVIYSNMLHKEAGFDFVDESLIRIAKQCALILVEEIMEVKKINVSTGMLTQYIYPEFWQEVKQILIDKY